jgi:hypothetical protein
LLGRKTDLRRKKFRILKQQGPQGILQVFIIIL